NVGMGRMITGGGHDSNAILSSDVPNTSGPITSWFVTTATVNPDAGRYRIDARAPISRPLWPQVRRPPREIVLTANPYGVGAWRRRLVDVSSIDASDWALRTLPP